MKWILFDKDGTLIHFDRSWMKIGLQLVDDFMTQYESAIGDVTEAYKRLGIVNNEIQQGTVMASGSLDEIINAFDNLAGQDVSSWAQQRSQTLVDQRVPENVWVEGVDQTVKALHQKGYKLGIVTSDTKKGVEQFLTDTNMHKYFDVVISTEANAVEKPNPEVLKPLFDNYDVDSSDVMIVGDTANDIKTGKNAQLGLSVAVLTGVDIKETFTEADYILPTANQVLDILN
ncbi:HAD family hydrolase [Staphylococcus arlettae]|uniref:HAD family hydrolase n=2 Tax=Staphylococcus arlettae TaxID=29378 RepID=UPI00113CA248|nr:HAD family hydrolase [Staphylococcus arlettae]MCD8833522.1 HAD family hydrolase [Staphylococcus arlettae]MCD9055850.1 HAD family hydrolase [Staphylococcus arlettae]MDT3894617.1 HAD family hydrolase [Staphylococcus arlettae]UXU49612.1 HAD family hydrolase [Staphylococcus arlettae]UXU52206.1 HAD family hydrolase [Staphylococcus arlettae]